MRDIGDLSLKATKNPFKLEVNQSQSYWHNGHKVAVKRLTDGFTVTLDSKISILTSQRMTLNDALESLDFITYGDFIRDILVNGRRVSESQAYDLLKEMRIRPPSEQNRDDYFETDLAQLRIVNLAPREKIVRKLKSGARLAIIRNKKSFRVATSNGVCFKYPVEGFNYEFATFISQLLTMPEEVALENAQLLLTRSKECTVKTPAGRQEIDLAESKTFNNIARCIVYGENPFINCLLDRECARPLAKK